MPDGTAKTSSATELQCMRQNLKTFDSSILMPSVSAHWPTFRRFPATMIRPRYFIQALLLIATTIALATDGAGEPIKTQPLRLSPFKPNGAFTRIDSSASGIEFRNALKPEHIKNYLLLGAGVTVGDYDADGLPDIFLCSQDGANKLYRQSAPWKFKDVTGAAGITAQKGWSSGAAFADVDNDGDLDLFVCNKGNHNELYRNQGDGTFKGGYVQQKNPAGAAPTMAAFSDYDRDGDLDLYLTKTRLLSLQEMFGYQIALVKDSEGNWQPHSKYGNEFEVIDGIPRELGSEDQLFENVGLTKSGIPRFIDVTEKSGIISAHEHGLAAVWWDANDDNWPDLYVSNDFHTPDHLYLNQHDGTFKEVTREAVPYTSWSSMGSDFADINNDGMIDYLSTDMSATTHFKQKTMMGAMIDTQWFLDNLEPRQYMRNVMLVNTGTGKFLDCAQLAGIDSTDWTWSAVFGDLDNDGLEDVFFTNGIERNVNDSDLAVRMNASKEEGATFQQLQQLLAATPRHAERNLAFRNNGDLTFENTSSSWGLDLNSVSHGAVLSDLDRDGDLDLVVNNMNDPVAIYRNDLAGPGTGSSGMLISLRGTRSNHFGLGARVVATTPAATHTRIITSSRGYMSGAEPVAHFGLGKENVVKSLAVHWPSGTVQTFADLAVGKHYTITEPENDAAEQPAETQVTPTLSDISDRSGIDFVHRENDYDDFADQPLLPNRMSRFGPALAVGDCNGDKRDDVYLGGAAGQSGALFLQRQNGTFSRGTQAAFESDAAHEDTAASFVDIDGDGDLDLYVVSGGASFDAGASNYQDRLYVNGGNGKFKAAQGALPAILTSGSCVAAADYDKDGDQDLFVGSRLVPKKYPHSSPSTLIVNGRDATRVVKLDLGMVTAATWADVDGDTFEDLLVTTEWGTPVVMRNNRGVLENATSQSGLSEYTGWWNGIAVRDVDADGDIDFVATNFGLNTKYHASEKSPALLYAGDFEGDGTMHIVEASTKENRILPVRGKSCSTNAMPHLAERFKTYSAFANASLMEIYTPEKIESAQTLSATTLASMLFINDGGGRFTGTPLPTLAQLTPGFGVALEDINHDGMIDCIIAQNFFHPQRETGRMNAGLGVLLRGDGRGGFSEVWPAESGLQFRDDARSISFFQGDESGPTIVIGVNGGRPRVLQARAR